ncbi:molecular chaperone Hsp90 [Carbonactinospora thermoautotrophica]|uniref:sacsin N-terminal ATP-binding-like domain-containing protein n=1 Tax=Carbonactinospora thermoautotrophica TaxID=1469144 RepID=UPI0022706F27|nr:molecular chaperone Hsp90 [Carbonactinospora thermoautotrophica]MCX9192683.1 molecular chaperone Hsp90 [Carbonactinospora thermoautotrophica]
MSEDVFGTAALRARVLQAWAASTSRFREDANAEEDLALGGYRDRLVIELAQNAADAAARARVPGRLRFTLKSGALAAANTGAPLDAAGVESLSTLRASAKRDEPGTVGRFGVGFSAVLAVTDEPAIISRHGGVRWSLPDARDLVQQVPALREELIRREGRVPVLRLPFPAEGTPPEGYDTVVVLPLRDAQADALARRLLAEIDAALLLALPQLAELVIEVDGQVRTLRADWRSHPEADYPELPWEPPAFSEVVVVESADGGEQRTTWRLARIGGELDPWLLADRPTEERLRPYWSVTWAVPVDEDGAPVSPPESTPRVVHAPTPTDEPLGLPALLLASFPLDPTRRHVAPGPLREFLVERAAETYAALLRHLRPTPALLSLVPGPVARGELDAEIRRAIVARLPETPFLPPAPVAAPAEEAGDVEEAGAEVRLRPRDALVIEGAGADLVRVLAPVLPGLVPAGWDHPALATAGVRRAPLAEVIELLADLRREPAWWRELYAALEGADPEALASLPVPLVDGRLARRPHRLLLAVEGVDPATLAPLRLRIVHPEAAHPLLERLGAVRATPRAVLADPDVRAAVAHSDEAEDPLEIAEAVLGLVRAADLAHGEEPWLADLTLRDAAGEYAAAGELMLPGSPIEKVVEPGALGLVDPGLVERWGEAVLEAVGVLRVFALVRDHDVVLDPDLCDHDLDAEDEWVAALLDALPAGDVPPTLPEFIAVRDLDLVARHAWPDALRLLAAPPLRAALTEPARVLLPDGRTRDLPSYTAWWLRGQPILDGQRPGELHLGVDPLLAGLYDEVSVDLDDEVLRALGVRTTLADLLAEAGGPDSLLARLADPARNVSRQQLRALYTALAGVEPERVQPPERLRALVGGVPAVVPAEEVTVVDAPDLLPLLESRPLIVVPAEAAGDLADLLALPLTSELVPGRVTSEGVPTPVPDAVRELLPDGPTEYVEHERLVVDGWAELDWRYVDGVVHAASLEGLARGLAWASGRWDRRFEIACLLAEPDLADWLRTERDFE